MSQVSSALVKGIAAAAVLAAASSAFALQEARTMLVTATIPGGCTLTVPPMAFGTLNVAAGTDETHTVTATYKCATGISVTSFSVGGSINGTFNGTMVGAANATAAIPYSITWDSANVAFTGQGFAVGKDVILNGLIRGASYVSQPPDNYSQSVIVAINF